MRRVSELDALRGLAALTVLLYHLRPEKLFFGWAAVDVFFVLSGYLITSILLRHQDSPRFWAAFYIRRGLRIWPVYYLTLVGLVALNPWLREPLPLDALPYYLTFTQNFWRYTGAEGPPFIPHFEHTWTLAIEEQFYMLWPLLLGLAGRKRLVPLSLALIGLAFVARAAGWHWWLLATRCDGFAWGGLLAVAFPAGSTTPGNARSARWWAWLGAGTLAVLALGCVWYGRPFLSPPHGPYWPAATILGVEIVACGLVALVLARAGGPGLAWLRLRPLVYLGQISYGLYMYHILVFWGIDALLKGVAPPLLIAAIELALSVAVASLSWRFIERPILGWKERFDYRNQTNPEPRHVPIELDGSGPLPCEP